MTSPPALARVKDLCLDATDPALLGRFYAGALDLRLEALDDGDVVLRGDSPEHTVWINRVPEPRTTKQRVHLDVHTPAVQHLVDLGATVLDASSFRWTVLADPEGHEICAFVRTDPPRTGLYEIGIDTVPGASASRRIATWWARLLGARVVHDEQGYSHVDRIPGAPFDSLDFVGVPEPKTVKNRVHLDLVGDVDAIVDHGATVLRPRDEEIGWDVLADPDGNELCVFAPAHT